MNLTYQGKQYFRKPDQSVLDCLLSHGVNIPNSCRAGVCCSCIMKSSNGKIPESAQAPLKESLKSQGYFLSCICNPQEDFEVLDPDHSIQTLGELVHLALLNDEVLQVRLKVPETFTFRSGQFISLIRPDGLTRSYSIASRSDSNHVELHIRIIPNGKMSSWIKDSVRIGDKISIRGPSGHCYYSMKNQEQPILLAGTGTGLAPLYGILQDALHQSHTGPIWLFHGGRNPFSLYLREKLEQLSVSYPQFQYRPSVLSGGCEGIPEVPLDQYILKSFQYLKNSRIYLCGDPQLVNSLRKKLFLAGASSKEIYADAFLPSLT